MCSRRSGSNTFGRRIGFKTGAPLLDDILGGFIPPGVLEIYGGESTGKTSLAISIAKEEAVSGYTVGIINQENTASPEFIRDQLGGNCVLASPSCGEAAIEASYQMLVHGVKVVVIDTTDAIVPLRETHTPIGERELLAQKRLVYHGFRVLANTAKKKDALVITTSQIRENPKVKRSRPRSSFHKVFRRVADSVIELKRESYKGEYGVVKFVKVRATAKRLLHSPPLGSANIYLWSGHGFDRGFELLRKLISDGVVTRSGAYWKGNGVSLGPGYDVAKKQVNSNYSQYVRLIGGQYE